jgi:Domain of unknown function (DUF4253)
MERRNLLKMFSAVLAVSGCNRAFAPTAKAYGLSDQERSMIAKLPFKHVQVAGSQAFSEWQKLKNAGGGWPVVIGGDENLSRIAEQLSLEDYQKPEQILKLASLTPFPASLAKHKADQAAKWKEYAKTHPGAGFDNVEEDPAPTLGTWPSGPVGETGLEVAIDIQSRKPLDHVHILIIPTQNGYEVPAYLNWGNWNECPPPEIHVTALRKWHDDFGAELVGISGDMMNIRVTKRPADRKAALSLAREQYDYCSDIVDQGVETLSNLAAGLMSSDWWYFWWD